MFRIKYTSLTILLLLMGLSGCSVLDSYGSSRSQARSVPQIPEIKRQTVLPPRYPVPNTPAAEVNRYPQTTTPAIQTEEQMAIAREQIKLEAKQRATVDIDPYASIPDSGTASKRLAKPDAPSSTTSPAVKSLMVSARADIALGKSSSAISKLERGLRIDSQNSNLWHLLAKAHYSASDYQQTISMAKKSIRYSNKDELIAENWKLIKKAGEKSGDATAVKEALDYTKVNP